MAVSHLLAWILFSDCKDANLLCVTLKLQNVGHLTMNESQCCHWVFLHFIRVSWKWLPAAFSRILIACFSGLVLSRHRWHHSSSWVLSGRPNFFGATFHNCPEMQQLQKGFISSPPRSLAESLKRDFPTWISIHHSIPNVIEFLLYLKVAKSQTYKGEKNPEELAK